MKSRLEHQNIVWVDLENPTRQEVIDVAAEFGLDTVTAEELLSPSVRVRIDRHERYVYLVLHFPALRHAHRRREQEVDFVIGHDFLITVHYDTVDPLEKFAKVFEVNSALEANIGERAVVVFYNLVKKLYKAVDHELDYIKRDLTMIEESIFLNRQVEMVAAISRSARELLNLRQTLEPHRDVLKNLDTEAADFFGEHFREYFKLLENDYYRVHNHIMRNTESLHELRETNNALLTTRQNETMRVLTILALLTFPLTLLVAIFDLHMPDNPFSHIPNGFWAIVGTVLSLAVGMFVYFKVKKWL